MQQLPCELGMVMLAYCRIGEERHAVQHGDLTRAVTIVQQNGAQAIVNAEHCARRALAELNPVAHHQPHLAWGVRKRDANGLAWDALAQFAPLDLQPLEYRVATVMPLGCDDEMSAVLDPRHHPLQTARDDARAIARKDQRAAWRQFAEFRGSPHHPRLLAHAFVETRCRQQKIAARLALVAHALAFRDALEIEVKPRGAARHQRDDNQGRKVPAHHAASVAKSVRQPAQSSSAAARSGTRAA